MSIRTERVASVIKHELGEIISREYNEPSFGFITVTDVRMSPDLKIAKIAISIFGADDVREKTLKMLESEKAHIRGLIGSRIQMKFTPALQFYHDNTLDNVDRINTLIKKIHDDESRDQE